MDYTIWIPRVLKTKGFRTCSVSVDERGKVLKASQPFEWAVGGGLHAVLSWCAQRKIRWSRGRVPSEQRELFQ